MKTPKPTSSIDPSLLAALGSIYTEVMWLSRRPNVTPSRARSWYTHAMAESVKRRVRMFSGEVSVKALSAPKAELRLEHFLRIQTRLTQLVERHRREEKCDPTEFIQEVLRCECVHIVTREENYAAMRAKGDYEVAGIVLRHWDTIDATCREALWRKMLRGKVANFADFKP